MIKNKRVLAIIPARGGSKGLPQKNIKLLNGKPLICWTIESALKSEYIDKIIVSTDSQEIANVAIASGIEVPFLRSAELASDNATSQDVVIHVLNELKERYSEEYDYMILLEPTSPLRKREDIDKMLEKLESVQDRYDGIVSIGGVHEHPEIMKKIDGLNLKPLIPDCNMIARRQDLEQVYFPYGVAYIVKVHTFYEERSFYPKSHTYYKIDRFQCYEIDDIYDFLAIESIIKHEMERL